MTPSANANTAPDDAVPSHRATATWPVWLLLIGLALPIFALGQTVAHLRTDEADSWLFAYFADRMLAGEELYGDYWDHKPPGIFWVNTLGLWIAGGSYGGVVALCIAASAATMVFFTICAWRWFGPWIAVLSAVLAAIYLWMPAYRGGTNRPELFVMLCDIAAVWAYARAFGSGRPRRWLLVGMLAGGSLLFKQTGLSALAAIGLHHAWCALRDHRLSVWAHELSAMACGLLAMLGTAILALACSADLGWAWDAVVGHVQRFADSHRGESLPRWFGMREHVEYLALPGILAAAGLLVAAARRLDRERSVPQQAQARPPALLLLLALWFAAATYLAFIGPSDSFHYVPTALTPLLLLAAFALHAALPWPRLPAHQQRLYRWLGVLWLGYMVLPAMENHMRWLQIAGHARFEDPNPFGTHFARDFVNRHTRPNESIYVWDYAPRIYWETRRPCPSRFTSTHNVPQVGPQGQFILDTIAADLAAAPPRVILLTERVAKQMAAGERDRTVRYRTVGRWLCEHYRPAVEGDPGSLLVRRELPPSAAE